MIFSYLFQFYLRVQKTFKFAHTSVAFGRSPFQHSWWWLVAGDLSEGVWIPVTVVPSSCFSLPRVDRIGLVSPNVPYQVSLIWSNTIAWLILILCKRSPGSAHVATGQNPPPQIFGYMVVADSKWSFFFWSLIYITYCTQRSFFQ